MRTVFLGNPPLGLAVLKRLHQVSEVALVVTQTAEPRRPNRTPTPRPVAEFARTHALPLAAVPRSDELASVVRDARPDVCVVAAYGHLVPGTALSVTDGRWLNVHSSLLPSYRGATPVQHAILDGTERTGVTIMEITAGLDAGPIVAQAPVSIDPTDTTRSLTERIAARGADLLVEVLAGYLDGSRPPKPQDESRASMTKPFTKSDGKIDWNRPASELERFVRAMQPWPGAHTTFNGVDITITRAHLGPGALAPGRFRKTAPLSIGTGDGLLVVDRMVPSGRREMDGSAWLNGVQHPGHFGT